MPCCAEKSPECQQTQKAEHMGSGREIMSPWDSPRFSTLTTLLSGKGTSAAI